VGDSTFKPTSTLRDDVVHGWFISTYSRFSLHCLQGHNTIAIGSVVKVGKLPQKKVFPFDVVRSAIRVDVAITPIYAAFRRFSKPPFTANIFPRTLETDLIICVKTPKYINVLVRLNMHSYVKNVPPCGA
jgi:hypothetical protein